MPNDYRPKFRNFHLLTEQESPIEERTDLDAGVLKTLSQVVEGLKIPLQSILGQDSNLNDTSLKGFHYEPTNILGNYKDKGIFIRPFEPGRADERGLPPDLDILNDNNSQIVQTLMHELIHSKPGASHTFDGEYKFNKLRDTAMRDPKVKSTMKYYSDNIPPDYFSNWQSKLRKYYNKQNKDYLK